MLVLATMDVGKKEEIDLGETGVESYVPRGAFSGLMS